MTWQTKKLGEICDILDNKRKPVTQRDRVSGKYPYYGATGIQDYVSDYIFDEKLILVGEDGAKWGAGENTAFIADGKYWVNNHAHVIRPHRNIVLDNWIIYFLNVNDLSEYITGLTVQKLNQSQLRSIEIPLPPLAEQKRIVKKLDEVFEKVTKAKENAEKNLQNSKELFEMYQREVFINSNNDWNWRTLGEIATFRNGMNFTKGSKGEVIKIVGVRDFQKSFLVPFESLASVTIDGKLSEIDLLKKDDILTVRSNGNPELIGRTLLAENVEGKVSHSGFTIRIRLNSQNVYPVYLCHYLKSKEARQSMVNSGTGINIKSLNQVALSSLTIPLPPLSEQKTIVKKLNTLSEQTKKLELNYRHKLADLEELKKSVLGKAFTGGL